jgi:hypothetical protein
MQACPNSQGAMPREIVKVPVGCQHRQLVTETELGQQCIDRSDLNSGAPAFVSQFGSVHMITPVGNQERQSGGHEFLAGFDRADQLAALVR